MSEWMLKVVWERLSEDLSENMSNRMLEGMSDRGLTGIWEECQKIDIRYARKVIRRYILKNVIKNLERIY